MNGTWGSPLFLEVIQQEKKKNKQTDFSYCHMPLLNNQISHPPRNRGCTESHYLLWLRGEGRHFFFDFLSKAGRVGVMVERAWDTQSSAYLHMHQHPLTDM